MSDREANDREEVPERTTAEQRILDVVAEDRGEEFAEGYAELILTQARLVGEL